MKTVPAKISKEAVWRLAERDQVRREKYRLRRIGAIHHKDDVYPQLLVLNTSKTHPKDTGGRWEPAIGYSGFATGYGG